MRIDKLLWFLRLAKTRTQAQTMAQAGHMRINGRRVDRAHQKVQCGDVLTVCQGCTVQVIEILTLPDRRGSAPLAQACYRVLDGGVVHPIAAPVVERSATRVPKGGQPGVPVANIVVKEDLQP